MAPGTLEVAITHGMNRGSGSAGQPEGGTGERNAKMKGAVRHVRFRTSDSGCRVSTGLSNGEVTTDPGGSCWWILLSGKSHGQRSLVGCRLWGHRVGHD